MSTLTNLLILLVIVFIILRISKKSKKKKKQKQTPHPYQTRRVARPVRTTQSTVHPTSKSPKGTDAFRRRAIELERLGRYQEAAEMYIKAGEIFSAAKAIASQGPEYVPQAVRIIEMYSPNRTEMIVRNLVRYFFDKGELQTAANFFHEINLHGEAEAIEALLPKRPKPTSSQRSSHHQRSTEHISSLQHAKELTSSTSSSMDNIKPPEGSPSPLITPPEQQVKLSQPVTSEKPLAELGKTKGPMMASIDLDESCMLCRKKIKAGEVYLKCPYCQNIYHRSHLLEWIKVKGTCPVCKHKLTAEMFEN